MTHRHRTRPATPRRRGRALAIVLATVVSLLSVGGVVLVPVGASSAAVASATTLPDDFYLPPSPLPSGAPGTIVRWRAATPGSPTTASLASGWQVMYLTTDALGQPTLATGTVLVPKAPVAGTRAVIGLGPGTHGPAFRCAPSRMITGGAFYEQPAVDDMVKDGYAVAVTDYEGYQPSSHTSYIVGRATGPALIDAVRAAQRLGVTGLSGNAPVVLRGYSQGGAASMWAGQMQPTYAPELNLVGVVGGGVPADLVQVALSLEGKLGFGLLAYALIGLDNAYPELDLPSYLTPTGSAAFASLESNDCILELMLHYQGQKLSSYTTKSPVLEPAWMARINENKLGTQPINAPVFQYQMSTDEVVPPSQAVTLRNTYCQMNVKVTWKAYNPNVTGLPTHIHGVSWGNQDARTFIADRIAGKPATTNC